MTYDLLEVTVPVAPLRAEPSDRSEMVSQMLAGERCKLLQRGEKDWIQVELVADSYRGWCDSKQLTAWSAEKEQTSSCHSVLMQAPISFWLLQEGAQCVIPAGARLACDLNGSWWLGSQRLEPLTALEACFTPCASPLEAALNFLGAPYLWGGKTTLGIDCSGLIQLAFTLCGKHLPRDASAQVSCGAAVAWESRAPGDLAFFSNEQGAVVHVGILASDQTILHAAGEVRLDRLDAQGIQKEGLHTHQLHSMRRVGESGSAQVEL